MAVLKPLALSGVPSGVGGVRSGQRARGEGRATSERRRRAQSQARGAMAGGFVEGERKALGGGECSRCGARRCFQRQGFGGVTGFTSRLKAEGDAVSEMAARRF